MYAATDCCAKKQKRKPLHPLARITEAQTKNLHLKNTTKREACQMYELNFVGVSIAWDPCDEGENPKCSICHTRLGYHEKLYFDLRGAVLGCSECCAVRDDEYLVDADDENEIVAEPGTYVWEYAEDMALVA